MPDFTKQEVEQALARPVQKDDQGRVVCQLCGKTYPSANQLGVHQISHRIPVGLAPPRMSMKDAARLPKNIRCGYLDCAAVVRRLHLSAHLRGVHSLDLTDASFFVRRRLDETLAEITLRETKMPVVVNGDTEVEEESPFNEGLDAVIAVTGILRAVRKDRMIPADLLPAVLDLIDHTGKVLEQARRM